MGWKKCPNVLCRNSKGNVNLLNATVEYDKSLCECPVYKCPDCGHVQPSTIDDSWFRHWMCAPSSQGGFGFHMGGFEEPGVEALKVMLRRIKEGNAPDTQKEENYGIDHLIYGLLYDHGLLGCSDIPHALSPAGEELLQYLESWPEDHDPLSYEASETLDVMEE